MENHHPRNDENLPITVAGAPVGKHLVDDAPFSKGENPYKQDDGSLIVIIATDAPLLPHQLKRLARRATIGMARTGSLGGNSSGDIFLAFSTANPGAAYGDEKGLSTIQTLSNDHLDRYYPRPPTRPKKGSLIRWLQRNP